MTEKTPDPVVLANVLRGLVIDAVEHAGHGHPGAAMGMADIAVALYSKHLKFHASSPEWHDRDRVVLSNGHAAIFLYSLLWLTGTPGITLEDLMSFRKAGSITPGHPEYGHTPSVETTTGPLGQGLGMAVGMAIAEKRLRQEFGNSICHHRTWVFAGDGCLMEGVGQEAVSLAGHLKLGHLNLLYDMNGITIDGATDLTFSEDTAAKFSALGWHVLNCCGHTPSEIDEALSAAKLETSRPSIILFRTEIGRGAPNMAGASKVHGTPLGAKEVAATKNALELPASPFEVSKDNLGAWRNFGRRSEAEYKASQERVNQLGKERRAEFARRQSKNYPPHFARLIQEVKKIWTEEQPTVATRKASQMCLSVVAEALPELIGGSADLSGSNLTSVPAVRDAFSPIQSGRYVNYGVREFAMGAAMNGIALHGGFVPYGGTFLVFSDYMRNAIRLSALMKTRVLYVFTHDSIGLGEDGPTHQPVEHLASLRAIPGLRVHRPADAIETLEAYQAALLHDGPTVLALSRQSTPFVRTEFQKENLAAKGGYVLHEPKTPRDVTLVATGTEVAIALDAAKSLQSKSISAAVVSLPCWAAFDAQRSSYRDAVLGTAPRIAIEAASPFGWSRYVGSEDNVIGVSGFGASASAEALYHAFDLVPDAVVRKVLSVTERSNPNSAR